MTTQLLTGHLIINQYNQNYTGQFRFQKVIPTMPVFLKCLESNEATNRKASEKTKAFNIKATKQHASEFMEKSKHPSRQLDVQS